MCLNSNKTQYTSIKVRRTLPEEHLEPAGLRGQAWLTYDTYSASNACYGNSSNRSIHPLVTYI